MKLYVHLEGQRPFTWIYRPPSDKKATVLDLITDFTNAYNTRQSSDTSLKVDAVRVENSKRREIESCRRVHKVFKDLDDVFVIDGGAKASTTQVQGSARSEGERDRDLAVKAEERKQRDSDGRRSGTSAASQRSEAKTSSVGSSSWSVVTKIVAQGEQLEKQKKFRQAVNCYRQGLALASGDKSLLIHLMNLWLHVGRLKLAEEWSQETLKHHGQDPEVLSLAGKIKHASGEYSAALEMYTKAIEMLEGSGASKSVNVKDLQLGAARAMYRMGPEYSQAAAKLVMEVVEPDNSHFEGLLEYAKLAYDRGLISDSLRVLLSLTVQDQEHDEVKLYLAKCLQQDNGFEILFEELKEGPGVASAYAFLASRVKDHGAVKAALRLYQKALDFEPANPSFALNYVHTLELEQSFDQIIEFCEDFCMKCKEKVGGDLELKEIARELGKLESKSSLGPCGWLSSAGWEPPPAEEAVEEIVQKVDYSPEQLDLVALIFTILKVLYIGGGLKSAAELIGPVDRARKASTKELHTTLIRNEAAYFGCVNQILKEHPPPAFVPATANNPLYLCGDSHCLSGAWQTVQLRGEDRLLVPQLVTGCKVWHLREESDFYPKVNFENTMRGIPDGAQVIIMFGEIDCREGIMLAVEKCKYDSEAEAIATTQDIYIRTLMQLISTRNFEIFVHPIAPVLDVTRPVVTSYMRRLKKEVLKTCAKPGMAGKLHWLEFFGKLLTPDGSKLKPEIAFDGTHMSPAYVKMLSEALQEIE